MKDPKNFGESKRYYPISESAEEVFLKKLTFSTGSLGGKRPLLLERRYES